jgi:hypothetical protein
VTIYTIGYARLVPADLVRVLDAIGPKSGGGAACG